MVPEASEHDRGAARVNWAGGAHGQRMGAWGGGRNGEPHPVPFLNPCAPERTSPNQKQRRQQQPLDTRTHTHEREDENTDKKRQKHGRKEPLGARETRRLQQTAWHCCSMSLLFPPPRGKSRDRTERHGAVCRRGHWFKSKGLPTIDSRQTRRFPPLSSSTTVTLFW